MIATALNAGLWTILFWICLGVALGGLIAWMLGGSSSSTQTRSFADLDGKMASIREDRTESADQLEAVEGIGPQIAELFHKNGVHRFGQIAAMAPADISKMLAAAGGAFAIAQPFTWPFQARLLENGWFAEFLQVGQKLRAGRLPITGLSGVGDATAERLAAADIGSVEALAGADAAALSAKLAAAGETVAESRLAGWIADAKALLSGDMAGLAAFFGLPAAVLSHRAATTFTSSREVTGPLVNAQSVFGSYLASTATASAKPSMLPVWLGLGGAALLALLCALGVWCPMKAQAPAPVMVEATAPVVPAPVVPTGSGLVSELRNGLPMLIIYFETAKSDVANELTAESAKLKDYLDANADSRLSVSGYVDPRGDPAFNAQLAKDRATKVRDALVAAGIGADRIDLDKPADIVAEEGSLSAERKVEVKIKEAGVVADAAVVEATGAQ